jgi:hypothetical protein
LRQTTILESEGQDIKLSYHIIFNNITFDCLKCMRNYINSFLKNDDTNYKLIEQCNKLIDLNPYKPISQLFRLPNQSKYGAKNKLKFLHNENNNDGYLTKLEKGIYNFECNCEISLFTNNNKYSTKNNNSVYQNDEIFEIKNNRQLIEKA